MNGSQKNFRTFTNHIDQCQSEKKHVFLPHSGVSADIGVLQYCYKEILILEVNIGVILEWS